MIKHNLDTCDWSQAAYEASRLTRQLYQAEIRRTSRKSSTNQKKCYKCFAPLRGEGIKVYGEDGYVHYCKKCMEKL